MDFVTDENIPVSVSEMLAANGHGARTIREHIPTGSPDALVATIAEQTNAILISTDGDFEKIAPRVPKAARNRFRRLSRIWMCCSEYQAAMRLQSALSLVEAEFLLASQRRDTRMHV